jgi:methylase of polypeptide subunit release factors
VTPAPTDIDLGPARLLLDRHRAHQEPYDVEIDGLHLLIEPGVFCPTFTKTSAFLAAHARVPVGAAVLDLFSGSGYQGLLAAKAGAASVVCVDISPTATRCAANNAVRNGVSDRLSALTGSLFDPVGAERFDVIIANPPLLPGRPTTAIEAAVFDPDLRHSKLFLDNAAWHLNPGGRIFLITTNAHRRMGIFDLAAIAERAGLTDELVAGLPLPYETYSVHELRLARSA